MPFLQKQQPSVLQGFSCCPGWACRKAEGLAAAAQLPSMPDHPSVQSESSKESAPLILLSSLPQAVNLLTAGRRKQRAQLCTALHTGGCCSSMAQLVLLRFIPRRPAAPARSTSCREPTPPALAVLMVSHLSISPQVPTPLPPALLHAAGCHGWRGASSGELAARSSLLQRQDFVFLLCTH